jgi:hypothetical protein
MSRQGFTIPVPNTNVGGHFNRYIIGGYGAEGTEGMDVIRLEDKAPDKSAVYWRCPPPFAFHQFICGYKPFGNNPFGAEGGLPEVFGGGDAWNGPWDPYANSVNSIDGKPAVDDTHPLSDAAPGEFIYGSPDGVKDGVILVLQNGSEVEKYVK